MPNILPHFKTRASIESILLVNLSITILASGYLVPTTNLFSTRGLAINTITFGKLNRISPRAGSHNGPRLFTSSSSQDKSSGNQPYLSEEEVHELLSGGLLKGQPSYPAWKSKRRRNQLYKLAEWATSDEANRPIICEFEPDALWLWTRWRGSVLSMTYVPIIFNIGIGILVNWYVHSHTATSWSLFSIPPVDDHLVQELAGFKALWEYQLTLCTFILAFFTSQAYSYWRSVYFTTRAIQGRINDICLIIVTNAERKPSRTVDGERMSDYSDRASELVDTCTRLIRVSHTFFWAAMPTNSNGVSDKGWEGKTYRVDIDNDDEGNNAIGPVLLSPSGLRYLEREGELTHAEVQTLLDSDLPPSQYTYMLMQWVGIYAMEGFRDGTLVGGDGAERELIRRLTDLRAEYFSIGDLCAGRMPLAYVQLLQILVDSLVWLAPVSLYSGLGTLSIPLCALLTYFFKGLLELSKSFLDPFGNDGYPNQNIRVDVLVSELNFGADSRWIEAAKRVPLPARPSPKKFATDTNLDNMSNSNPNG